MSNEDKPAIGYADGRTFAIDAERAKRAEEVSAQVRAAGVELSDFVDSIRDKYAPGVAIGAVVGLSRVILAELSTEPDAIAAIKAFASIVAIEAGIPDPYPGLAAAVAKRLEEVGTPEIETPKA